MHTKHQHRIESRQKTASGGLKDGGKFLACLESFVLLESCLEVGVVLDVLL
jgi:hypothetical protein